MLIKSIIFVALYIFFIFFISLFIGLNLHNIKLHNIYIKHLFVKIDKKLILKANSITIIPQQKVSKDVISIHRQIYYISKITPIFQNLSFKNIKYKKIIIPLVSYQNKKLKIIAPDTKISGILYPYKNYTILNNINITYKNFHIQNINGDIAFDKKINFKISASIQKNKFLFQGNLNKNDNLFLKINIKKLHFKYKKHIISAKNTNIDYFVNLHYFINKLSLKSDYFSFDNNYILKDIKASYFKNNINFLVDNAKIKHIDNIKNISADYIKGSYYIPDNLLIIPYNNNFSFSYKKAHFIFNDNSLIFKSINNFNFYTKKINLNYQKYHIRANNGKILKYGKFIYFEITNNTIKNKIIDIYNDIVYGYKNRIEIPNIQGTYKNINFRVTNTLINIPLKKAIIANININGFVFTPTYISYKNNTVYVHTISKNITINNNFKKIVKDFNITIPLTQLKGKNEFSVNAEYKINTKKYKFNTELNSSKSVFDINGTMFSYDYLKADLNNTELNAKIKNLFIPLNFMKTSLDCNITATKTYLNMFAYVKFFKLLNYVNINDYHEKIVTDFKNKIIYFLNSEIYINIAQKEIYLLKLKKLLKYTPFQSIIKDGGIYIKIGKNVIIDGMLDLIYPVITNKQNPNIINAFILINKNNIDILNQFIKVKIKNMERYNINIKNADINIKNLITIYNNLDNIINKSASSNNGSKMSLLEINSTNTNFIYDNHKFLSQQAQIIYKNNRFKIYSKYKNSVLKGYTKQGYFLMEGKNYKKEELIPLLDFFKHFRKIDLDFILVKSPDGFYTGKVYLNNAILNELTALNNIIAFLNTIPSILSLSSPGYSAKGYKIKQGFINYLYYNNILYLKQIDIKGENIDFKGKGYINFNTKKINLKIEAVMKMKLKKIPIIGKGISYIFFGKDGNIDVKILVQGDINNPKVSQNLGKSILLTPFKLFKRVLTLPFNLF